MDNLRQVIKTLFVEANAEDILQQNRKKDSKKGFASDVSSDWMIDVLDHNSRGYTRDEVRYLQQVTNDSWLLAPQSSVGGMQDKRKSVFYSLLHFTDKVLTDEDDEPICRFSQLLRWRELSYLMGEDLFTLAYLANKDIRIGRKRNYFSWRAIINNDNKPLREILARGTSELHFHLWGSAFVNEINWISLMNDVTGRKDQFAKLKSPKAPDTIYGFGGNVPLPLHERCLKAAALRVYLFQEVYDIKFYKENKEKDKDHKLDQIKDNDSSEETIVEETKHDSDSWLSELIYSKTKSEAALFREQLQGRINCLRYEFGYRLEDDILDYALSQKLAEGDEVNSHRAKLILIGERKFIYDALWKCYSDSDKSKSFSTDPDFETFLYAYLIIKNDFRKEIVQVNDRIGFANFADYQGRKGDFVKANTIYKKIAGPSAILATMFDQSIKYLEARMSPDKNINKLKSSIRDSDSQVNSPVFLKTPKWKQCQVCLKKCEKCFVDCNELPLDYYYILHFNKSKEKDYRRYALDFLSKNPRSFRLREDVKAKAETIKMLYNNDTYIRSRIVGVDAANSEIGCRPEVFAQAFRFLGQHIHLNHEEYFLDSHFTSIGITYHAGEDYLDIVDGLRAIDETVLFLNYEPGDRIGHALALGIDAIDYYRLKNYTLVMPKHDYIDNLAWLLMKIKIYNVGLSSKVIDNLTSEFMLVYKDIYQESAVDLDTYYQAWLLRGDDPMNYFDYKNTDIEYKEAFSFWEECGMNKYIPEMEVARKNQEVRYIVHKYHFDANAKLRGQECAEFDVIDGYDRLVATVQHKMRHELAGKHIAIECNPTSNQVIGTYKRYANHPILAFNNHRLHHDPAKMADNPQLSVSLNTDDQGVFSTYLENEYALMAIALEKEKDENGNRKYTSMSINNYLDHIRELGNEQRFVKRETNDK